MFFVYVKRSFFLDQSHERCCGSSDLEAALPPPWFRPEPLPAAAALIGITFRNVLFGLMIGEYLLPLAWRTLKGDALAITGDGPATTNCPYRSRNARSGFGVFGVHPAEGDLSVAPRAPLSLPLGFNLSSCDDNRDANVFFVPLPPFLADQPLPLTESCKKRRRKLF